MSYTLLLDSSNTSLTVGLANDGKLLDSVSYEAWQSQSEHMIPEIEKIFKDLKIEAKDINNIATTIGPGSYTGVRISLTIAKTLATVLPIKVYALSALQVLKSNDHVSICLMNARSGRSYIGVYKGNEVILPDQIMENDKVLEFIKNNPSYKVCGDVKYLGLDGLKSNVALEMLNIMPSIKACENPLALTPVYMRS